MQIQQLRYVVKAAEKKNFSAAAKELYISQPSLSQQILKLEQELEIPLFIRHSKSVTLTDAGEQFVLSAQRIINNIDQLTDLMHKYSCLQSGTFRVGMLWIASYLKLPQILTDFRQQYPDIAYELTIDGSKALLEMLQSHTINAAFLISNEKELQRNEELHYQKLMDDYYVAVVDRNHPLTKKSILKMEDFQEHTIIMPSKDSAFRLELELLFAKHYVTPRVVCETSQSDIGMQLAEDGLGIYFSSNSIAHALKTDNHVIIPLKEDLHRTIFYVTLKDLLDYPVTKRFTAFMKNYSFKTKSNK